MIFILKSQYLRLADSLQKMYILKLAKQNIINEKGRAESPTEGSRDRLFHKDELKVRLEALLF